MRRSALATRFLAQSRAIGRRRCRVRIGVIALAPGERRVVQRVIHGSPGIKDLAGVGEIVGHVKDLLVRLIDHGSTRRQRNLENDRREWENQQLQVEIARQFVGMAQDLCYSTREMRQLVSAAKDEQKPRVGLIAAGKITSADTVDESRQ